MLHCRGAGASGELRRVDETGAAVALPPDPAVPASSAPHRTEAIRIMKEVGGGDINAGFRTFQTDFLPSGSH